MLSSWICRLPPAQASVSRWDPDVPSLKANSRSVRLRLAACVFGAQEAIRSAPATGARSCAQLSCRLPTGPAA